ncbi:MAG: VPLPA-CTERM sorting domain-containing protein [Pseudomonadota bacterium]
MFEIRRLAAICTAVFLALPATAATISGSSTGVANADVEIGFGEIATTGAITTQYSGLGLSFTPGLTRLNNNPNRPNFTTPYLGNFGGANPFSMIFTNTVTDASFAMTSNGGIQTTFTALLKGIIVESFTTAVSRPPVNGNPRDPNNFYGFTGLLFDEINVSVGESGNSSIVGLDTVAFNVAAVPVPASLPLLFAGLGGLALMRCRRPTANA